MINSDPDYRFGFNGMLRDDDVRDEKLTSDNEGKGNSYSTEYRFYDNRVGRWLSIDPLASKFPWSSPYVALGNNPVIMVDPDGDWYWVANNNARIVNDVLASSKSSNSGIIIQRMEESQVKIYEAKLNKYVNEWNNPNSVHYAPKIAEYVGKMENRIPIIIGEIENSEDGGYCFPNLKYSNQIFNPIMLRSNFEGFQLIHETVHNMYGESEFNTYSAMVAAGYISKDYLKILTEPINSPIFDKSKYDDETIKQISNFQNSITPYLPEGTPSMYNSFEDFYIFMQDRGKELIGRKDKTNGN